MQADNASVYEDRGVLLWVVNSTFIGLATLAVIARFAARRLKNLPLAADDWAICVALIAYILGPPTVKLSLLLLYRRIFVSSRFLRIVYAVGAIISVWTIITIFLAIFNCIPISGFWTGQGQCISFRDFAIGYAIVNIITDLAVWLMPIPNMWKLQLPTSQKIALTLIFVLGLIDCGAALVRLFSSVLVIGNWDVTYYYGRGFIWSIIEVSLGIVCTCLPTMRVILKIVLSRSFARGFGFSSLTPRPRRSSKGGWVRASKYNELLGPWSVQPGAGNQSHSNVTMGVRRENGASAAREIRVLEEIKVELQHIKAPSPTAPCLGP
ncbi:hypothetical protein BDV32DRAFT_158222 [Aspergillus pseudonomiae]|uniref:Rhodopsin domain-containing protein n=1 Tax=Aspergillus pseudonomiae TaxID=1506151 RepID=A0A5N7D1P7_9EURO|nr:uncharacterized protein BDV37DRAFT_297034 [Aspergillus pseudonomiae]KAB8261482.1 hypothetical protein BDV32DRAFT_158222 [Aspergillus pseudonomiae]KAE8400335.1 hypothetical protein BDV37DRAFT_297034 [Aspergillus pseudonomiae]